MYTLNLKSDTIFCNIFIEFCSPPLEQFPTVRFGHLNFLLDPFLDACFPSELLPCPFVLQTVETQMQLKFSMPVSLYFSWLYYPRIF